MHLGGKDSIDLPIRDHVGLEGLPEVVERIDLVLRRSLIASHFFYLATVTDHFDES